MSFFVTFRTGQPGNHQFSPRYIYASFEEAHASAESFFVKRGAKYLIEDERGHITYHLKDQH
jgi:hypothetical protein